MINHRRISHYLVLAGCVALLGGACASTAPTAAFSQQIPKESLITAPDQVIVTVNAAQGVTMLPSDKQALEERVKAKITDRQAQNRGEGEKKSYAVELEMTRFEKGNAFARAMLAGLGQIHLDGIVKLFELPDKKPAGQFAVKKTFAWGGLYGGMTRIEDIEDSFADGIAAALTGQQNQGTK